MVSKKNDVLTMIDSAVLAGINLDKVINDLEDKPIPLENDSDNFFTIGKACINALMHPYENENIDGDKKLDRYLLAMQLKKGGVQDLSPEQITELKTLVGKFYTPLVVGQVLLALDPGLKNRKAS